MHAAFSALLAGASLPPAFNRGQICFLPKDTGAQTSGEVFKAPEATRPLTLSNTDNKLFGSALSIPLGQQAQYSCAELQCGFIKGRNIIDNLIALESHLLEHATFFGQKFAGLFLLDIKSAFPSLDHEWLFHVLRELGIPEYFVAAIEQLYADVEVDILLRGKRFPGFRVTRG